MQGHTPLYVAASSGNVKMVKDLIQARASPNMDYGAEEKHAYQDAREDRAKRCGQTPLFIATQNSNIEIMKVLLKANASADIHNEIFNKTPLIMATEWDHNDVVKVLLEGKASADIPDKNSGRTSLCIASRVGNITIVKALIEANASTNVLDKDRGTALSIALYAEWYCQDRRTNVVECLLNSKANPLQLRSPSLVGAEGYLFEIAKLFDETRHILDIAAKNAALELPRVLRENYLLHKVTAKLVVQYLFSPDWFQP